MNDEALVAAISRKSLESAQTLSAFVDRSAGDIVQIARGLLDRFERGGRLYTLGNGGSACDAEHLAVELAHPVFEKRRALPAISLATAQAFMTAVSNDQDFAVSFSSQLRVYAGPNDAVIAFSTSGRARNVVRAREVGRDLGMLTVAVTGRDGGDVTDLADHVLVVPSFSIHRIQEVHAFITHALWDVLHLLSGSEDIL
jgi:D-sedoheptulose 7-phosphate isomerase